MQQNLLLASPDPVASLLSGRGGPGGGRCDWLSCSSERALKLLLAGSVHAACIQTLLRPERGEAPLAPKLPGVVRVAEWDAVYSLVESRGAMRSSQTGITVARLSQEATFEDYIRERLGQRRLDPSWVECKTPFDCARELVSGNAALAVAPSFLAQRMSLSSVATLRVRLSLLVQRECQAQEAVQHMLKRLESRPLLSDLAAVGGYSLRRLLT